MTITTANVTKTGYYDSATGAVYTGSRMWLGANLGKRAYWDTARPFINELKHAGTSVASGTPTGPDANGYYDTSSSGSFRFFIERTNGPSWPTGTYHLVWTGTATPVWSGRTPTDSTANHYQYTNGSNAYITFSGGTLTHAALYHEDDAADYAAGKYVKQQIKDDLNGMPVLRFMDWMETNNSVYETYADYKSADNATFFLENDPSYKKVAVPLEVIAELCNDINADCWICIPHFMEDAGVTSICNELNTRLDASRKVWVELTNETWNFGSAFRYQWAWSQWSDAGLKTVSVNGGTEVVTDTAHGYTGTEAIYIYKSWPDEGYLKVIDADTYYINFQHDQDAITGVTLTGTDPVVVTFSSHNLSDGDTVYITDVVGTTELNGNTYTVANSTSTTIELSGTDSSLFTAYTSGGNAFGVSDLTKSSYDIYVKSDSTNTSAENYAPRAAEIWALADNSNLTSSRVIAVGGAKGADVDRSTDLLAASTAFKDRIDYMAIAAYIDISSYANIENLTNAEILTKFKGSANSTQTTRLVEHITSTGKYNIVFYEGGDEHYDLTAGEQTVIHAFLASDEGQEAYEYYMERMAEYGGVGFCIYNSHSAFNASTWGLMRYAGDTTCGKYKAFKKYMDQGGVPG